MKNKIEIVINSKPFKPADGIYRGPPTPINKDEIKKTKKVIKAIGPIAQAGALAGIMNAAAQLPQRRLNQPPRNEMERLADLITAATKAEEEHARRQWKEALTQEDPAND